MVYTSFAILFCFDALTKFTRERACLRGDVQVLPHMPCSIGQFSSASQERIIRL